VKKRDVIFLAGSVSNKNLIHQK